MLLCTLEASMLALNEHATDIICIRRSEALSKVIVCEGGFLRVSRLISVKSYLYFLESYVVFIGK